MSHSKPDIVALEAFLPFVEEWLNQSFTVHRVWQADNRDAAIDALRGTRSGESRRSVTIGWTVPCSIGCPR